jgi:hypothetical protein
MITIRQTQTREDLRKYTETCRKLTQAMQDGMILRFILDDEVPIEGYLHRVHMDAKGAIYGNYWGYVEVITEQNIPYIIDLLQVKDIQNITTQGVLQKYADRGVILLVDSFKG